MITARTMLELKAKVYKAEGWVPRYPENRTGRVAVVYDIKLDAKNNRFTATRKQLKRELNND